MSYIIDKVQAEKLKREFNLTDEDIKLMNAFEFIWMRKNKKLIQNTN